MPRARSYMDFSDYEVKVIKGLYAVYKMYNGNIKVNLKDHIEVIEEDIYITNLNQLSHMQIIQQVMLHTKYLFQIRLEGYEVDIIQAIIKLR